MSVQAEVSHRNRRAVVQRAVNSELSAISPRRGTQTLSGLFLSLLAVIFVVFGNGVSHSLAAQDRNAPDVSRSALDEEGGGPKAWRFWGGNIHNTHSSSSEKLLEVSNVSGLAVKWAFTTGSDVSATPTVQGHAVYVPDWAGNLFKIDADTGVVIWSKKISDRKSVV